MFAVPEGTVALPADRAAAHPVRIALDLAADASRWHPLLRYDTPRWSGLLERTEGYEAWLLSWLPGQHTARHDHGAATGAFTVVAGTLVEIGRGGRHELTAGQSRVFAPGCVHKVRNDGPLAAVSIHVYRPGRPVEFLP